MKKYIIIIIVIIISYFIGYYNQPIQSKITESRLKSTYQYINPLLECDNGSISQNTNLDKLKNTIKSLTSDNQTSVYYRDMNNGPWFGINEKELFSPASLVKVPLMMAFLKKAESDPLILDKEILNTEKYDPTTQNIQPLITIIPNQKYTIRQLIEQMIIYSDDVSYTILNNQLSAAEITKVYSDLGVDISQAQSNPNGNILSVKSYASFFRILFNASYLNRDMSEYALKLLSQVKFKDGLVAGVPNNIIVSHKFGERQYLDTGLKQLHDCGIVYMPNKPYLLCIMTRGNDFKTMESIIKNISETIYSGLLDN